MRAACVVLVDRACTMPPQDLPSSENTPWYVVDMQADPNAPQPPQGEWWSDEPPMENYRHLMQMIALITTLRWLWRDRTDYFVGGNLSIYYSQTRARSEDFRGPDFFVALGVDGTRDRRSWVVWQEDGRYPNVIVELLSESTEANDRGVKKDIYEQVFRTPEYFLFDPYEYVLEGYRLLGGRYVAIEPDNRGLLACEQLGLMFGVYEDQLRFFTTEGVLVQKPEEELLDARQELDELRKRAERAEAELRDRDRR
jgi:Uma2 family endonuclease